MIKDRRAKIDQIVNTIKTRISEINQRYRSGPDLHFYKRIIELRNHSDSIQSFLSSDYHMEMLYATLVSWDMNSRAAKMKYFTEFKANILSNLGRLAELENWERAGNLNSAAAISILRSIYDSLNVMKSGGKLVSNSKLLHFLFPNSYMPMDRNNTLWYFYGNTGESPNKYVEIIELSFEIMSMPEKWDTYLDNNWNTTVPKMIDNAILLCGLERALGSSW
jgi:hypothetical protein